LYTVRADMFPQQTVEIQDAIELGRGRVAFSLEGSSCFDQFPASFRKRDIDPL
jgi:hypothetical protein